MAPISLSRKKEDWLRKVSNDALKDVFENRIGARMEEVFSPEPSSRFIFQMDQPDPKQEKKPKIVMKKYSAFE